MSNTMGGNKGVPDKKCLGIIRKAALWIFGVLFDIQDPGQELENALVGVTPPPPPQHDKSYDRAIDAEYGVIQVADQTFYTSELLFSVDYAAYTEVGTRLCQNSQQDSAEVPQE